MLSPSFGRDGGHGAFQDLKQALLDAFSGNVSCNGDVFSLSGDLVDLIDVDDAFLGPADVPSGGVDQSEQDVLHVLPHVSRLGQGRGVRNGEGHVQKLCQGPGQAGLAGAGGTDQKDVALFDADVLSGRLKDSLIVVVNGNGQCPLGLFLADHILVQECSDLPGPFQSGLQIFSLFQADDLPEILPLF